MLLFLMAAVAGSSATTAANLDAAYVAERHARVRCTIQRVHVPAGKTIVGGIPRCDGLAKAVAARKSVERAVALASASTGETSITQ